MKMLEITNFYLKDLIENINLSLEDKKIYALIGKSGSGKTQLAKSILRLSTIKNEGDILVNNKKDYLVGVDVSIIFQDISSSLNPVLKILDQIIEAPIYHKIYSKKEAINKTKELFSMLNLDENILYQYPHQLSGGQKQRILIASALICNPKLLICDEITTGLDPENIRNLMDILIKQDKCILFISHNLFVISEYIDEIIILNNKKIEFFGNINKLKYEKNNEYIKNICKYLEK